MIEKIAALALAIGLVCGFAGGWTVAGYFHRGAALKQAKAQAKADAESRKQEQANTQTSKRVSDKTRTQAQEQQDKVKEDAQQAITIIKREYVPTACPSPKPIPDSVQAAIREAEQALAGAR